MNNKATFDIRIANANRERMTPRHVASSRISQLISPFENAISLSPHFDGEHKGEPIERKLNAVETRSVRHLVLARTVLYKEEYARPRGCKGKRVISSPLMRCRRDDPRAIYAALFLSLSLIHVSSSSSSPRTPGDRVT